MANNQRLNAIITVGAAMAGSVRTTMRGVAGRLQEVNSEIGQITRRQRELERQRAVWQQQGRDVDALDRELNDLNRTLDTLRQRQQRLRGIGDALTNVGGAARGAFRTVATQAAVATAAIGATAAAVYSLVSETARLGDDAATVAAQIGMQASALQELQFAAEQSDVSTADFNVSMETLVRNIGLAERGLGRARPALEELGLSAEELGRMLPEEALGVIADRMAEVESQAQRVSIATQLFGGAGADMALMLTAGSQGLAEMRAEARALGLVLSDEALVAAGEFDNEIRRGQMALRGMRTTIGSALIPTVTALASEFTAFAVENRPLIAEFATALGEGFREAIPVIMEVVSGLGQVGSAIGSVLSFSADLLGGWNNLGIAVGAAFVAPSILAIGRLGAAIGGLILATGPVGMVIAGVALAAGLIIANWDTIKEAGIAAWEGLRDGAGAAVDWVVEKFQWLADRVNELLAPIREAFGWVGSQVERVSNWWNDRESGSLPRSNYVDPANELSGVPGYRRGGPMMPGAALVGEGGPELIFPSRAGYVATARQTERLMGGGGARSVNVGNITINAGPGADPRAIADEVVRVLADRERSALYDGSFA